MAIGAISAGGAWYTGSKLDGVLNTSITDANKELQAALAGSNGTASLELVSLDRHVFSSTAHYRLKGEGEMFGEAPVELLFVDRIEHMAIQRHQFQRRRAVGTSQRDLQLSVGVGDRGIQHSIEFAAGVPRTASADCTDGHDNS